MTPEEAYEEARRRIRQAEETGALELDLSGLKDGKYTGLEILPRLPPELERLASLIAQALVRATQRRLICAGASDFASDARTLRVHATQRSFPARKSHFPPNARPASLSRHSPVCAAQILAAHVKGRACLRIDRFKVAQSGPLEKEKAENAKAERRATFGLRAIVFPILVIVAYFIRVLGGDRSRSGGACGASLLPSCQGFSFFELCWSWKFVRPLTGLFDGERAETCSRSGTKIT